MATLSIAPSTLKIVVGNKAATTKIDFKGNQRIKFRTSKSTNGLVYTQASYCKFENEMGYTTESHVIFQDYSERIATHPTIKRATDKALVTAHEQTLNAKLEYVLEQVQKQYGTLELI